MDGTKFSANVGIPQRKFTEIASRKCLSRTKFLDQMQNAVIAKIEADTSNIRLNLMNISNNNCNRRHTTDSDKRCYNMSVKCTTYLK